MSAVSWIRYPDAKRDASPKSRTIWHNIHALSRHEPAPLERVSSGVCTPGSMRIR